MNAPDDIPGTREESIFADALDLPAEARGGHLDQACRGDTVLRARVEVLLAAIDHAGDLLESPPPGAKELLVAGTGNGATLHEKPGDRINGYRLVEEIGVGGCGIVYLAEQEKPVRRQVALKIIKLGMDTRRVVARFEFERQTLAVMDHPNIAQVFDAGQTPSGRLFFVMEYVAGVRLTDYCDRRKLSTNKRLDLFLQVCSAIQHAHQKGIIHRDIKPSNILVTESNKTPRVKVIDFGIAKATSQQILADNTVFTAVNQFVGTPAYMSPEQARGSGTEVDTRSDIYSLGALLYELLTGSTPLDSNHLLSLGLDELCRTVREQEPPIPSTRLTASGERALADTAERHGTESPHLVQTLRGDLDWIVMKALEKDPARRYDSVGSLAEDVRRHQEHEPVLARPPSAAYILHKMFRRHKLAFAAGAAVFTSLVLGLAISSRLYFEEQAARLTGEQALIQTERARRETQQERDAALKAQGEAVSQKQRADREAGNATAVSQFLQNDLLRQAGAWEQVSAGHDPDANLSVRTAVTRAADKVAERFADRPIAEAGVRHAIGEAFGGMGDYQKAIPHLERAYSLRKEHLGAEAPATVQAMSSLATAYRMMRRYDDALALTGEMERIQVATLGPDHPDTRHARSEAANVNSAMGKPEQAIPVLESMLAAEMASQQPDEPALVSLMYNLGLSYRLNGQPDKSIELHLRGFELARSRLGMKHPLTVLLGRSIGSHYVDHGEYDKGLPILEEALKQELINQGEHFPSSLDFMDEVSYAYERAGRSDRAMELKEEVFKRRRLSVGVANPLSYWSLMGLADAYEKAGRQADLRKSFLNILEILVRDKDASGLRNACLDRLVKVSGEQEDVINRALGVFQQEFQRCRTDLGAAHADTYGALQCLADAYERMGRQAALEQFLLKTLAGLEAEGSAPYLCVTCMERLEKACGQLGRAEEAAGWRARHIALKTSLDASKEKLN